MHRAETRRMVLCALVVVLLAAVPQAQGALQEFPMRQEIMDTVAVLRLLYKHQLDYQSRIRLVEHNTTTTLAQIDTIDKLILSETREPGNDIGRFLGYAGTHQELLEQLRQFGYDDYMTVLERAKKTLDAAVSYARQQRDAVVDAGDEEAVENFDRILQNLEQEVTAVQSRMERYASGGNRVDYIALYNRRLTALRKEIQKYESLLAARETEYKALFGHEVPVNTDYQSDADRLYPVDTTPGILVID